MSKLTFQQRGNQNTRIPVGQRRTAGGKALEDNRASFAAKQLKQDETAQRELHPAKPNNTGLPDQLKNGIESLSGMSMDNVKVHYNSSQPAQLNALAYAQGTDIHVGPGQEQHLPHEAWHVVQQAQGRVKPTMQMKEGVPVSDDKSLDHESDVMGRRAVACIAQTVSGANKSIDSDLTNASAQFQTAQLAKATTIKHSTGTINAMGDNRRVGKKMEAELNPKEPVKGSATGVNSDWMKWIRTQYPNANVVRGHLLNHDLGGFAVEENLYPISTLANANHSSQVEQKVKGALSWADAVNDRWVKYDVTVEEKNSYQHSQFICDWKAYNPDDTVFKEDKKTIDSNLGTDKGGFGGGKKEQQSPIAWRHGKSKGGTEVAAIRKRLGEAISDGKVAISATDHGGTQDSSSQDEVEWLFDMVEKYGIGVVWSVLIEESAEHDFCKELIDILEKEPDENWD